MEKAFEISSEVLEKINRYAVEPLTAEQVYCFSVVLCDNDIDRDLERFSDESLETLAKLFEGKTGIFDHDPKGEKQTARIFDTQIVQPQGRLTADGKPYRALQARAYMVRTAANDDLIREISGGIKKEVSVSCAVARQICSVCGCDRSKVSCSHIKGRKYGEKLCFITLDKPTDAYEWSFVAVPAQVNAGVTKRFEKREESRAVAKLKSELSDSSRKLGAAYEHIKGEVLRLSYFCKPFYTAGQVAEMTRDMDIYRLLELEKQLRAQVVSRSRELEAENDSFITRKDQACENNEYTI